VALIQSFLTGNGCRERERERGDNMQQRPEPGLEPAPAAAARDCGATSEPGQPAVLLREESGTLFHVHALAG